jgi:hypothetical protein
MTVTRLPARAAGTLCTDERPRGARVNDSTSRWWVLLTFGTLLLLLALMIHVSK